MYYENKLKCENKRDLFAFLICVCASPKREKKENNTNRKIRKFQILDFVSFHVC